MKIGKAIKQIRGQLNLNQGDLARLCDISQAALPQIESDKIKAGDETLDKICLALGVSKSLLYILSIEKGDMPYEKAALYDVVFPSIVQLASSLIGNKDKVG